jgi:hypothetical protein
MIRRITRAGANEAGAWAFYSDGTEYRFAYSTNQTVMDSFEQGRVIFEGRVGC